MELFWWIGLLATLYISQFIIWWIYSTFFRSIDLKKYRSSQSWAVITGSTDGIGLSFAQVLAEHGFNILLVSRNKDKLEQVKKQISSLNKKIQVDYVVSNAMDVSPENIESVKEKLKSRDFSVLVNNVGIGQGGLKQLHELDPKNIEETIRVNCIYPTLLTRSLLPSLLNHKGPKLVINLASVAGLVMNPFSSVYGPSKAFNRMFSLALSSEYYSQDLEVLCVDPGFVESQMTKMKPSLICCTARECVESTLRKIGDLEVIPHWKHGLLYTLSATQHLLPRSIMPKFVYHTVLRVRQKTGRMKDL